LAGRILYAVAPGLYSGFYRAALGARLPQVPSYQASPGEPWFVAYVGRVWGVGVAASVYLLPVQAGGVECVLGRVSPAVFPHTPVVLAAAALEGFEPLVVGVAPAGALEHVFISCRGAGREPLALWGELLAALGHPLLEEELLGGLGMPAAAEGLAYLSPSGITTSPPSWAPYVPLSRGAAEESFYPWQPVGAVGDLAVLVARALSHPRPARTL